MVMEEGSELNLAERKRRIRAVLFDKDGTLVDFERTWFAVARELALEAAGGNEHAARRLMEAGGYDFEAGRFRGGSTIAAGTNADIVGLWYPGLEGRAREARIADFDRMSAEVGARSAVAIEGAADALARLHARGYAIGVATNDSTRGAELTVQALGFAPLMSAVLGYDIVLNPKPAADPVLHFARLTGVEPAAIAVVGDNAHDLEMARAAGAGLAIGVLSGNSGQAELEPLADVVLASVAGLPRFFEEG
jgi:phosphoglycolate phosphatase